MAQVDRLQRRFEKSALAHSALPWIKKAMRKRKQEEAWAERHQVARANQVTMYRKYRTGDLPGMLLLTIVSP